VSHMDGWRMTDRRSRIDLEINWRICSRIDSEMDSQMDSRICGHCGVWLQEGLSGLHPRQVGIPPFPKCSFSRFDCGISDFRFPVPFRFSIDGTVSFEDALAEITCTREILSWEAQRIGMSLDGVLHRWATIASGKAQI
jgi:hypothetical protein